MLTTTEALVRCRVDTVAAEWTECTKSCGQLPVASKVKGPLARVGPFLHRESCCDGERQSRKGSK